MVRKTFYGVDIVDFGGCVVVVDGFGWYRDVLDELLAVVVEVCVVYQTLLARLRPGESCVFRSSKCTCRYSSALAMQSRIERREEGERERISSGSQNTLGNNQRKDKTQRKLTEENV